MTPLTTVPLRRLVRASRAWLVIAFWTLLALAPAVLERMRATGHGADHALLGFYSAISLPFFAYSALSAVLGRDGLGPSGIALAGFGAPSGRVAAHAVTVAVLTSAVLGGSTGAAVAVVAHGSLDPPLGLDAARAFAAGALGGAAYASYFALGASFGARGYGRSVLLVLDWILGSDVSASALLTPRGHVRSLLGGGAPLDVSSRVSYAALAGMVVVFGWLAVMRAARVRWNPARG